MDVQIAGLSRWRPLDLEADPDDHARVLAAEFGATPNVDVVAAGIAGFAGNLRRVHAEEDAMLLAAWLFLTSDEQLTPLAHATLRGVRVAPEQTAADLVRELLDESDVYGDPLVEERATASGPATGVVYRTVREVEGERVVSELACVVWARADDGYAVVLTGVSDDLVEAHEMPDALLQLADGVAGL